MSRRSAFFKALFCVTLLLLLFVTYWFYVKPLLAINDQLELVELSLGDMAKWGLLKAGVFSILTFFIFSLGMSFSEYLSKLREHTDKVGLISTVVITIGLICLVAFLGNMVSNIAVKAVSSGIIPSTSLWGAIALELLTFASGVILSFI